MPRRYTDIKTIYEKMMDVLRDMRYENGQDTSRSQAAKGRVPGDAYDVGSDTYCQTLKQSGLTGRELVMLPIRQMGGYLDANGMLQLGDVVFEADEQRHITGMNRRSGGYCFAEDLAPYSFFWDLYAREVQAVYGENGLDNKLLHQFRMYIDLHNILYVRSRYKGEGMSDEGALEAYVWAELGGRLLREGARYHNKYPGSSTYEAYKKGCENKKRLTPDHHSEFIIDREGNFVSRWNVLELDVITGEIISRYAYYEKRYGEDALRWAYIQEQIMDTESFNYASVSGQNYMHRSLDITPPGRHDAMLRRTIGSSWKNANVKEYDYSSDLGDAYSES